eukprot:scaffold440800_cov25-Prasinocladus_malaysianus.AAC.1
MDAARGREGSTPLGGLAGELLGREAVQPDPQLCHRGPRGLPELTPQSLLAPFAPAEHNRRVRPPRSVLVLVLAGP